MTLKIEKFHQRDHREFSYPDTKECKGMFKACPEPVEGGHAEGVRAGFFNIPLNMAFNQFDRIDVERNPIEIDLTGMPTKSLTQEQPRLRPGLRRIPGR